MNCIRQILLVEDSPADAEMTMDALASSNVINEIIHVEDGPAALDYLRRQGCYATRSPGNPTFILLDLKMPKMNGLEVLREIRSDEEFCLIPIVMLTSSAEEKDMIESYRLGVNSYVVKPLNFGEFASVVASLGVFWAAINNPPPKARNGAKE
ncbi:response regulator [Holophaga foetida]|uniref:response regulator n=1 Tax=Holophaga foetida TaxID=35839 RepID=UPI0002471C76|nr:response regulator [Holophaga foetida]